MGLADNTIGLLFHGRPFQGRLEYAVGIFDSVKFEKLGPGGTLESDQLMPAGRIVLHLLDPATPADGYADYRESYIGQGQRLAIGAHSAYLHNAINSGDEFDVYAWGVDLFFNAGRFVFQGEYDWFMEDMKGGLSDDKGDGWYVQGGYLLCHRGCCVLELAARYQELDPEKDVFGDQLRWTSVGLNLYIREHHLKIQTEYTFKKEQGGEIDNDMFQIQLQLDY